MPTYQYTCTDCGEPLEAIQSFTDPSLTHCPACGGRLRKVYSAVGVVFKGSGFYRTDSRAGAGKTESGAKADGGKTDGAKADGGTSDGAKSAGSGSGSRSKSSDGSGSGSGSTAASSSGSGSSGSSGTSGSSGSSSTRTAAAP